MSANAQIFPQIQTPDPKTVGGVAPSADQAIDMGLSVKWAPWNIGASRAEEYGAYFYFVIDIQLFIINCNK